MVQFKRSPLRQLVEQASPNPDYPNMKNIFDALHNEYGQWGVLEEEEESTVEVEDVAQNYYYYDDKECENVLAANPDVD